MLSAIDFVAEYETIVNDIEKVSNPKYAEVFAELRQIDPHELIEPHQYFPSENAAYGFVFKMLMDRLKKRGWDYSYQTGGQLDLFEDMGMASGGYMAKGGLIAPNGKPSNLTPEQYKLVRTPEFKAWFGDWENDPNNASKVVDENGEPLIVWHGTDKKFNVFKINDKNPYSFFAKNYNYAFNYATDEYKIGKPTLYECFLNIRNPLIVTHSMFHNNSKYLAEHLIHIILKDTKKGKIKEIENFDYQNAFNELREFIEAQDTGEGLSLWFIFRTDGQDYNEYKKGRADWLSSKNKNKKSSWLKKFLSRFGYDGFVQYENIHGEPVNQSYAKIVKSNDSYASLVFAVFNSEQIKLADGSNTTFDAGNPDIRYASGGYMAKGGQLLASSPTLDGIKDIVSKYYYSSNIRLDRMGDTNLYEVSNAKGKINGVKVEFSKGRYRFLSTMKDGGVMDDGETNGDAQFIEYKGEEIMYVPYLNEYYVWDEQFESLESAKSHIDKGQRYSAKEINAYRHGAMANGGMMENGGIVGGYDNLTDKLLAQKIEMFLDKVSPVKFYYVDKDSNTLLVGFDENFKQDAAERVYKAATSSAEFFDADNVDMEFKPEIGDTVFKIKLKRDVEYGEGGYMAKGGDVDSFIEKSGDKIQSDIDKLLNKRNQLEDKLFDAKIKENERWNRLGWGSGMRLSKINVSTRKSDSIKEKMEEIDKQLISLGYNKFPVGRFENGGKVTFREKVEAIKAKVAHKEHGVEYYRNDNLIEPTEDQKLLWDISGLPNDVKKHEQSFETIIDEIKGKSKKDVLTQFDRNFEEGKYNYLGWNPDIRLEFDDTMASGGTMAKGGKVTFREKVEAIKASLLKKKKVSPKVQKDYGKTYSPKEAEESAKRIAGAMTARERIKAILKKRKK